MPFWSYVLAVAVIILVIFFGVRLKPGNRSTGTVYGVGKKLRKSHAGQTAPMPYDPTHLVNLAEEQIPDDIEIIKSLKNSTTILGFCPCGCGQPFFIDPRSAVWSKVEHITLLSPHETVVLHVVLGKRVGSIEQY